MRPYFKMWALGLWFFIGAIPPFSSANSQLALSSFFKTGPTEVFVKISWAQLLSQSELWEMIDPHVKPVIELTRALSKQIKSAKLRPGDWLLAIRISHQKAFWAIQVLDKSPSRIAASAIMALIRKHLKSQPYFQYQIPPGFLITNFPIQKRPYRIELASLLRLPYHFIYLSPERLNRISAQFFPAIKVQTGHLIKWRLETQRIYFDFSPGLQWSDWKTQKDLLNRTAQGFHKLAPAIQTVFLTPDPQIFQLIFQSQLKAYPKYVKPKPKPMTGEKYHLFEYWVDDNKILLSERYRHDLTTTILSEMEMRGEIEPAAQTVAQYLIQTLSPGQTLLYHRFSDLLFKKERFLPPQRKYRITLSMYEKMVYFQQICDRLTDLTWVLNIQKAKMDGFGVIHYLY